MGVLVLLFAIGIALVLVGVLLLMCFDNDGSIISFIPIVIGVGLAFWAGVAWLIIYVLRDIGVL